MIIEQEMKFKRETPGAFLFEITNGERKIDSLYVRKTAFGGHRPERIKVLVDVTEFSGEAK